MADMGISGVASGIDWESLIDKMMAKARKPAEVMLNKQDNLRNKKTLWEELKVSLQNFQSTLSPLKLASTFKAKQIEIDRLDNNASHKGVLTATVTADADVALHDIEVLQLAKGQIVRSDSISGTLASNFSKYGVADSSYFYINAGGKKLKIEVTKQDTLDSIAKKVNNTLKTQEPPIGVTASVVDNKLILKSDRTGLETADVSSTLTRTANSYETVDFYMPPGEGTLVIKDKDNKEYLEGVDFDVVDGNQIRWRTQKPTAAPAGSDYQVTYKASGDEAYVVKNLIRNSGTNVDANPLPFTPQGTDVQLQGKLKITSAGVDYLYGTDFQFSADGESILWKTNRPADGAPYQLEYTPDINEEFTLNIKRGNVDEEMTGSGVPSFSDFAAGTTTIEYDGKTYVQGVDFDVVQTFTSSGNPSGNAAISWRPEAAWDAPPPAAEYDVILEKSDGTKVTVDDVERATQDTFNMEDFGFSLPSGSWGTFDLTANQGGTVGTPDYSFTGPIFDVTQDPDTNGDVIFTWDAAGVPSPGPRPNGAPAYGVEYTVTYTYNANTFSLEDDNTGVLKALGMDKLDEDHYTAACDAILLLEGEKVTRSSNFIGESYDNELIKGMTIELKGVGHVSLDVSQDAETAVTSLQAFVDSYNEVMDWVNFYTTQKQVDQSVEGTIDSDDFRTKWGLLHGNSLLREIKNSMRVQTSKVFDLPFTYRSSRDAVYGTMLSNGILQESSFTIKVGGKTATIRVSPEDTLDTIADKINSTDQDGDAAALHYDSDGKAISALVKASVENGKLVLKSGTDQKSITVSGNNALSAMEMNYEYTSLTQIGISTFKGSDYGKSGNLEFDNSKLMDALKKNPEDVSTLVTTFAGEMQTWVDNMIKSTQKEVAPGVTSATGAIQREIEGLESEIKSIETYLTEFDRRLTQKEESLYKQYAAAETSLAKLLEQASWLQSVTSQLQGYSSE